MDLSMLFGGTTAAKILLYLSQHSEGTALEICKAAGLPKAQVFIQLKRLKEANVLQFRTEKNRNFYFLNTKSEAHAALKQFLAKCA